MNRRGFLQGLGFGGVLGATAAVTVPAEAAVTERRRDLAWARERVAEGHRVRLEKWAHEKRAEIQGDEGVVTIRQGSPAGIIELDELVVTVEVLEGPWEIVPEEDYPKPPPPPTPVQESGGDVMLWGGDAGAGGDLFFVAGGRRAPQLRLHGSGS
jgi:hypothetical protein